MVDRTYVHFETSSPQYSPVFTSPHSPVQENALGTEGIGITAEQSPIEHVAEEEPTLA